MFKDVNPYCLHFIFAHISYSSNHSAEAEVWAYQKWLAEWLMMLFVSMLLLKQWQDAGVETWHASLVWQEDNVLVFIFLFIDLLFINADKYIFNAWLHYSQGKIKGDRLIQQQEVCPVLTGCYAWLFQYSPDYIACWSLHWGPQSPLNCMDKLVWCSVFRCRCCMVSWMRWNLHLTTCRLKCPTWLKMMNCGLLKISR